jgi:twitching motility protein PilT
MNVLVVDDEPTIRRMSVRILEKAGHSCVAAASGTEAQVLLASHQIDVALLDVRMPGESGLDLARLIQRSYAHTSVIMVTGTADFTSVSEARLAGAVDYVVKPVEPAALVESVERAGLRSKRKGQRETPAPPVGTTPPVATTPPPLAKGLAPITDEPTIDRLFHLLFEAGASDLHLAANVRPLMRKDGEMMPLEPDAEPLSASDVVRLVNPVIPGKNRDEFEAIHDTDFAYEIPGLSRFRGNVFMDRNGMAAVFRIVRNEITSADDLGLTPAMIQLCELRKGLVLVTGPTGSGKSTTLAAMIDYINRTRSEHIITIEDPIEFVHVNRKCLVNQRELHSHTVSFKGALRAALREDPDVILIGEMRDLETIAIALEAAETGHLVFGTLHTTTAASTVDRIIDQFPGDRQAQIRVMLSESLKGVIAQTLCRKTDGGRVAAWEVLIVTSAISNIIRGGKTFQIPSMMQVGRGSGMQMLNDALIDLVRAGTVSVDEARARSIDRDAFDAQLAGPGAERPRAPGVAPLPPNTRA